MWILHSLPLFCSVQRFEVVMESVGRCPGGGLRIELDRTAVGGVLVVHHYGHGGAGLQASVGSALEAVAVLKGALE
ncbi:hypothetical protein EDC01DRAFT_618849 [Geopyxis carbonaria]|nr:hypothetical protein EDC01DRAFT_618849 [Geopyxis carbonaria]